MRILRFDSVGGASGDMILAAMAALGVSLDRIREGLASLGGDPFELRAEALSNYGLQGTRMRVVLHTHEHGHAHPHAHAHAHRRLAEIRRMVDGSALPPDVKRLSLRVFERLAGAEARVHGTTPEDIHFHEVGAMDSIVDIVGSCLALHLLDVGGVRVGPLPDGQGTTTFSHGVMPIPVPAVVELLMGHPVIQTDEPYEMVTPTGAALLMTWKETLPAGGPDAAAIPLRTGNAFGHRKLDRRPNLLRATLLEVTEGAPGRDECLVLECNLDDMTPELIGGMTQSLLATGALDVFTTPVQMKKQRPGVLLTLLCHPDLRDALVNRIFAESTTFGIREYPVRRTVLARRHEEIATPYGTVRIKVGTWKGRDVTRSPEHSDCVSCAEAAGVPARLVYEAAVRLQEPQKDRG